LNPTEVLESGWGIMGAELTPLGAGHINDTLLASSSSHPLAVLQRINEQVFTDPELVMSNLARVQAHLCERAPGMIPPLLDTLDGLSSFCDTQGGWWRLWAYLPDGRTLQQTSNADCCRAAAYAFGCFQRLLSDLPGPALAPTIPGFLELGGYLDQLDASIAAASDAQAVLAEACGGMDFIDRHRGLAGLLPKGDAVIHGDCKLNNLLFELDRYEVSAVLDLDTIMVGHWAWDFGDLARSVLTGVLNDERADVDQLNRQLFAALVDGFQAGRETALDAQALSVAPSYVSFMLGVRFLTDHLQGDEYFKVGARGDNLERARRQFALIERLPVAEFEAVARGVLRR